MLLGHKSYRPRAKAEPSTRVFLVLPNVESAALFSCPFVLTMRQMLNLGNGTNRADRVRGRVRR